MTRELVIIQHEEGTPPGTTLEWARERGVKTRLLGPADLAGLTLDPNTQSLLVCGGTMNTDQEDRHPWLKDEKRLMTKALGDGVKIFGICLGGQLLAEVLGGKVRAMGRWETGWHPVQTPEGAVTAFHWHQCTFDLPPGAERVFTNDFCPNQGFRWRDHVGLQFHPEVDETWVEGCIEDGKDLPGVGATQDAATIREMTPRHLPALRRWYFKTLDEWWSST